MNFLSVLADRAREVDSCGIFSVEVGPPKPRVCSVEIDVHIFE